MAAAAKPDITQLANEIKTVKPEDKLKHHVEPPSVDPALVQAKTLGQIKKGVELHKTEHTAVEAESAALVQAKTLGAIHKGVELKHADKPKDGLTQAEKDAFLEERRNSLGKK